MIAIGEYNKLTIQRETTNGLMLSDETGEEVLLPTKVCPDKYKINDSISVFVYHDKANIKVATTLTPKIVLHDFAFLQVKDMTPVGSFLDWGLEKGLLVPFNEQQQDMVVGKWYIVYLDIDEKDRLFASTLIEKQLQNINITVEEGDEIDLMIYQKTDLGYNVIVNNEHIGLIYNNEIFTDLNIGDKRKGYIKHIREDNKLDIALQPAGFRNVIDPNIKLIYDKLISNNGFLEITDKSAPEDIYNMFGISKKAFKRAIGALYKQRKITIEPKGIKLLVQQN